MNKEIVQKENKILREIAKEVPISDIESRKVQTIIKRMSKSLSNEEDGIAIAAPQIGESLRIFVVSKKIFEIMREEKKLSRKNKMDDSENLESIEKYNIKDLVFINPEILKMSKKKNLLEEGCLSVRWLYGKVERSEKTLIKALDENGKPFTMGGSGILSQVFQHEIDHLNGTLFIDKATDLRDLPPEKQK